MKLKEKVIRVPIENIEERYSKQWNIWFPREFQRLKIPFQEVYGKELVKGIQNGQFLDVYGTNFFKATQLQILVLMLHSNQIKSGDIIFFDDLWFPGIEMLAYIRQATGLKFKIAGVLHAGTYDPNDFISQKGMGEWGRMIEEGWFQFIDYIFVATNYHKNLIVSSRNVSEKKIHVTGLPIYPEDLPGWSDKKQNIVVFPHRKAPEKCPELFEYLKRRLQPSNPDWEFVYAKDQAKTKMQYYRLLNRSKIVVSFAKQETWGIAQQEGVFYGCIPLVPNRLSYHEMYPEIFRYEDLDDCEAKLQDMLSSTRSYETKRRLLCAKLKESGENAILNIMRTIYPQLLTGEEREEYENLVFLSTEMNDGKLSKKDYKKTLDRVIKNKLIPNHLIGHFLLDDAVDGKEM